MNEAVLTKIRNRQLDPEHKRKISEAHKGVKFSEERKANIGKAKEVVLNQDQVDLLLKLWEIKYVPEWYMLEQVDISKRVYNRYKEKLCTVEQVRFLPQRLTPENISDTIKLFESGLPWKDIVSESKMSEKETVSFFKKLSPHHPNMQWIQRPRPKKTEEHKAKLSQILSEYNKKNCLKGELNPNWKGGISALADLIRVCSEYKAWRQQVYKRDGYKCINCQSNKILEADHIYPFCLLLKDGDIKTLEDAKVYQPLWNVSNGRTLCHECHVKTKTYGIKAKHYYGTNEQQ